MENGVQQNGFSNNNKPPDSPHRGLKQLGGIWLGKLLLKASRVSGRGGTTLPGRAALKLSPELIPLLARQLRQGSLIVTGTNGKTTTSTMLTGILKEHGLECIHNQSGSNMSWGVASSLIGTSTWSARLPGDFAVMEVDEGAFPEVVNNLQPRGAVVTNIFRDQLDRFGETDNIRRKIEQGLEALPPGGFQVLNADDPSLAGMRGSSERQQWSYGIELDLPPDRFLNTARDIKTCPHCYHALHYDQVYFAHLGRYRCLACDFSRPEPDVKLVGRELMPTGDTVLDLSLRGEPLRVVYPLMGTYNLYNALAAITGALALNVTPAVIGTALAKAAPSFGRMERFTIKDRTLLMVLIKNPVGANEVLRTLIEQQGDLHMLIALNDKIADGTDVSWLWDVDFEQLNEVRNRFSTIVVTGDRAWDMALRLKYAGLDPGDMQVQENMKEAILRAVELTPPGETLFVLPTYTAMLEMRRILNSMGVGKPYWEGS